MKIPKPRRVWFVRPSWYWYGWKTLLPIIFGTDEYNRHTIEIGWTITGRIGIATWSRPCWHVDREAGAIYLYIPSRFPHFGLRQVEVAPGVIVELTKDALGESVVGIEILHRHWASEKR